MTILERKAFISSNPRIVLSSCPPPCGHFSIQESASGGLSYKARKNPALQDSPPAAGRYKRHLPFRRSAILPGRAFYAIGNSNGISYSIKKALIFRLRNPDPDVPLRAESLAGEAADTFS